MTDINTDLRDQKRGFRINAKALALSFLIESVVIVAAACVGVSLAARYNLDGVSAPVNVAFLGGWILLPPLQNDAWWLAIVATIMVCAAELARVPLVILFRTHRSRMVRWLMLVGVLAMIGVSTKTISQALEQQFHGRLIEVQETTAELKLADAQLDLAERKRTGAMALSNPKVADVASIDAKIVETQKSLQAMGAQPKPVCTKAVYGKKNRKTGKRPLLQGAKCTQPKWAGTALLQQLDTLQAERAEAASNRDLAVQASAAIETDIAAAKIAVAEAADKQREALSQSQLHSFVGMVQGKAPVAVTDDELFRFLRLFIFVPALLIAGSSTLLELRCDITTKFVCTRDGCQPAKLVMVPIAPIDGVMEEIKKGEFLETASQLGAVYLSFGQCG